MIFLTTLNQMAYLFSLIILGYILAKTKLVPENSDTVLSKLENNIFIPALILSTFIANFTPDKLSSSAELILGSAIIEAIVIPVTLFLTRFISKDRHTRNVSIYGLCFANFGFVGNAVVMAIFPDIFFEYIVYVLVMWVLIYLWAVPSLLMGDGRGGIKESLMRLCNPMFICMIIGMVIGLSGIKLPSFALTLTKSAGDCMSPIAMLLTGMTIAKMDIKRLLGIKCVYVVTTLRLIVYPAVFMAVCFVFGRHFSDTFIICATAALAMPLGLNTVVIPSAYGRDTSVAAGMALVSHVLAVITIPIVFYVMQVLL